MSAIFFLIMVIVLIKSPLGRAMADRLAGRVPDSRGLSDEDIDLIHQLEDRVMDLEERLEYTERLVQQQKERERLKAGG
ncbi:MAG: hypothetical protein IIB90_05745 [Gemmatimonadetes bacterium]|nr:hypothetical protein [Gemmatimonadota bacterium]